STVAECLETARLVDHFVPVPRDVAVRCPFRISCFLRARRVSRVPFDIGPIYPFRSRRSTVRGGINVDLRNDRLSRGCSDSEHGAAIPAEFRGDRNRSSEPGGSLSMAAEPILGALDAPFVARRRLVYTAVLSDYWAITKPEVNFLILITSFVGF